MNTHKNKLLIEIYKNNFAIGAASLLAAWIGALLTVTFLPGPYMFDFFGVVAERYGDSSSVKINSLAIVVGLIVLPILLTIVEVLKRKSNR